MSHGGEARLLLDLNDERRTFLSAQPAGAAERRLAAWTVGVSAAVFLALVPFAKAQLPPLPAFIGAYQSALLVADLVTALLLFSQFAFQGAPGLVLLGAGYLFTAAMAATHALTFPGLFANGGLLGAGPQTTAWIYMFWHAGFPALVLAYARIAPEARAVSKPRLIASAVAGVGVAAAIFTALATAGQQSLPAIMQGNRYTPVMLAVVTSVWLLSVLALAALWRKRVHTILDLWLMVVMCAWTFDIGLAAVFNGGRYDLGFYAGRLYGLLAGTFVLGVLLVDNARLYRRLIEAYGAERQERQNAQEKTAELAAVNKELDAFSYSVSHDLRAPLRAIDGYARMLEEDMGARLDAEGRRLLGVVRSSGARMGRLIDDLLEFSRLGRQALKRRTVDMAELAREASAEAGRANALARIEIDPLPPASADGALLRQVWLNLIGNAVKYSAKRAEPRIQIGGRREDGGVLYWVRDNGAGFDMRYAERLFGVFQRLHHADEFPGTGVGLAIVQRVVVRHGGRVWAEGRQNEGATFYFSLPDAPADEGDKRL